MRIQKLLRLQIASFMPAGFEKLTDVKAKEKASEKQKMAFMTWSNDVNKRAALKDYLVIPRAPDEEEPETVEPAAPASRPAPAAPAKRK